MTTDRAKQISVDLQDLARLISAFLDERSPGEPLGFVLLLSFDGVAQYISNTSRPEAKALIESLVERWNTPHRADIPAHYNPNL